MLAVVYIADGWEHGRSIDTPAVCAGTFASHTVRSNLCAAGRIDFLSQATKQWAERRDTSDYDTKIDLHYGPFDDGLRVGVSGKVGYGLDADALDDGDEESKAIKKSQSDLLTLSAPLRGTRKTGVETDLASSV